ncbi:Mor transcription activator family protein [Levilactobacillus tujiorum]|uniref:Mor transcription activator family protein n=1 Tax=Levilactobacillus tujiorum TaxID=2912243 RepID=UPI001456F34C|nr:Mor transcription activator family protein [Levilactobacillus tujiorum]NLR31012.1 hypothetical protein [Levilactobacillus tujiorum]
MDEVVGWQELYREMASIVGTTATRKLWRYYGGSQVSFPKRLWDPKLEAVQIRQERRSGMGVAELARRHQYSSRTIRRILAQTKD